jgi:hypothetical protein
MLLKNNAPLFDHFSEVPFAQSLMVFADPIILDPATWSNTLNHHYPHLLLSLQPPGSSVWPGGLHTASGPSPIQDHMVVKIGF